MGAIVTIRLGTDLPAASVAAELSGATDWVQLREVLGQYLAGVSAVRGSALAVTCDDVASGTVLADVAVTATCTQASIVADDTVVIGNVTLTWKSSAANENQVTIGASDTAAAANLAAAINAHSKLSGLVSASSSSGVCTITYPGADRTAALIGLSETGSGVVLSATSFTSGATLAAEVATPITKRWGI